MAGDQGMGAQVHSWPLQDEADPPGHLGNEGETGGPDSSEALGREAGSWGHCPLPAAEPSPSATSPGPRPPSQCTPLRLSVRLCYCCPGPSAARFGTLPRAGGRLAMQLHTTQRAPVPPCYRGSGILLGPRAFCSQVARESVVAAVHSVTRTHRGLPSGATCSPPPAQTQPNRPGALPGLCPPGGPVLQSSSHAACVRTWAVARR